QLALTLLLGRLALLIGEASASGATTHADHVAGAPPAKVSSHAAPPDPLGRSASFARNDSLRKTRADNVQTIGKIIISDYSQKLHRIGLETNSPHSSGGTN